MCDLAAGHCQGVVVQYIPKPGSRQAATSSVLQPKQQCIYVFPGTHSSTDVSDGSTVEAAGR